MNIAKLTDSQWQQLIELYTEYSRNYISLIKPKSISSNIWDEWEQAINKHMDSLSNSQTRDEIRGGLERIKVDGIGGKSKDVTADQLCDILGVDANITLDQELPFNGVGFITLDTNDILEFVRYKVESLKDMSNLELYKFLSQNKEQIKEMMR